MSSVALEELSKVNNPDYVIMMSSGLSQLGIVDCKFISERLCYCSGGHEGWKTQAITRSGVKRCFKSSIMGNVGTFLELDSYWGLKVWVSQPLLLRFFLLKMLCLSKVFQKFLQEGGLKQKLTDKSLKSNELTWNIVRSRPSCPTFSLFIF